MGKKVHPFLLRTGYYPLYKIFNKTPFNFNQTNILNYKLNLDILSFFKKIENEFLILDIKINYLKYNKIIIYLYIPFINQNLFKNLYLQLPNKDIKLLINKFNKLNKDINLKYHKKYNIYFDIIYSKKDFNYQNYILFFIKNLMKNTFSFKNIFNKTTEELNILFKNNSLIMYGIKIKISGRINGSELSKVEEFKQGIIPLQTIINNIQYSYKSIKTKFGILGIKVWIFLY